MILSWLTTVLGSIVIGIVLTLFLQYYFYKKYFSDKGCEIRDNGVVQEPLQLPKLFADLLRNSNISPNDSCMAVNLLLQFLFHELRDTERVRQWFRRKLSLEFEQLLSLSAIGRMIAYIKIREINLGSEFPVLTNISVEDVKVNDNYSHIDTLDLKLDLSYSGNFRLVIDIGLLGKSAHISVTVNELYGEGRLQFSRLPYSHWSFTFYNDPKLQLDVISQFQGRVYQQITTLISNQIIRGLRRMHTLPHYKMRYKPFFDVIPKDLKAGNIAAGQIQLIIHRVSRLNEDLANNRDVYILAGTDYLPWIEIRNYGNSNYFLLDIVIVKRSRNLGLLFKQSLIEDKDEYCLVVDEIKPSGFKSSEDLNPGDIIVCVEGKGVNSVNQLNKVIKSMPTQFTLRIERKINTEKSGQPDNTNAVLSSQNCPIYNGLRRRKGSESESCTSTPSPSLPGSPARRNYFRNPLDVSKLASTLQPEVAHKCDELCQKILKTKCLPNNQIVQFDESFIFSAKSSERYLNINIRAKENDSQSDKLLGYVNIPLHNLEASDDDLKIFFWKPPDLLASSSRNHKLSCHSGFSPYLCYGDLVLTLHYMSLTEVLSNPPTGKIPEIIEPNLTASESTDSFQESIETSERKHDFVKTHFNRPPQCDFCGKKIWLKDAERCRECGMSIHKKCVMKCISESVCLPQSSIPKITDEITAPSGSVSTITFNIEDADGYSSKSKSDISEESTPHSTPKKGLGGLLANVASRSLKRVGSANNLVLPGGQFPSLHSKSLPPSPQQSPAPSRKPSLPTELSDEIASVLETLMQQGSNHGDLMYFAKESGKTLYEELDIAERKEKINDMVNKLRGAINAEVESRCLLEKEEQSLKDANEKAKVAFLIGKSDEKTQALTTLMLHFCAGLQHIQDLEEQEREMFASLNSIQDSSPLT